MPHLDTFHPACNVAVVGASGGIGRALVEIITADPRVASVHAFSRSPVHSPPGNATPGHVDLNVESTIETAAEAASANAPLDLVIVATGILHQGAGLQPEKSLRELDPQALITSYAVNAIGPAMVAKHFLPRMRQDHQTVFAALSARIGSISDNRLGGWASYRASKAALNMLLKTIAIEQSRTSPRSIIAGLHPGTVDTKLSSPFTRRVPESQLFTPDQSAAHLLKVINALQPEDTGGLFAWDGKRIDY